MAKFGNYSSRIFEIRFFKHGPIHLETLFGEMGCTFGCVLYLPAQKKTLSPFFIVTSPSGWVSPTERGGGGEVVWGLSRVLIRRSTNLKIFFSLQYSYHPSETQPPNTRSPTHINPTLNLNLRSRPFHTSRTESHAALGWLRTSMLNFLFLFRTYPHDICPLHFLVLNIFLFIVRDFFPCQKHLH